MLLVSGPVQKPHLFSQVLALPWLARFPESSVVKADFLKAVRKVVSKRLIRLLKGCYM